MAHDYNAPRKTNDTAIARARIEKGWTQAKLAQALGVKQSMIAQWETGARKPKLDALQRIGNALGVDWVTLIDK